MKILWVFRRSELDKLDKYEKKRPFKIIMRILHNIILLLFVLGSIGCTEELDSKPSSEEPTVSNFSLVYAIDEKPSGMKEANRLGIWYPISDFDAVGLYLPPGKSMEVIVKNIEGDSEPKLLVGTYSRYNAGDIPTTINLVSGTNTVKDSKGGLLYLRYVTDESPSGKVEVTFSGGEPVPVYKLGETSHEQWLEMLDTMSFRNVQMVSERTMVVVSKETALSYKDVSQDEMLMKLDRAWDMEDYISGIDGSSELHKSNVHKLLITETADPDYFMAANRYRVMVSHDACDRIMDPKRISSNSWGIWHEMGHMHQTIRWDWAQVDEVTVNIYSLAALYGFNGAMVWLKGHDIWDVLEDYFQVPLDDRNYNTSGMLTGKGRLAMFRQLWMAFGDEFYIKVHQLSREDNGESQRVKSRSFNYGNEKMAYFMLISSKACGYNLKDFFIQWGFKLPQEAFDALDALNLPDPEIDLLKLRE